jgi:hypothetical protein
MQVIIRVLFLALLAAVYSGAAGDPAARAANNTQPSLFVGGVAGIHDLADPKKSQSFRSGGGGLYLHSLAWGRLPPEEKRSILSVFQGTPIGIEFGFGSGKTWGKVYQKDYLAYGMKPVFIAANAFSNNNHPTPDQWRAYSAALHAAGVPASTLILPTFEYQNFRANMDSLSDNKISLSPTFQGIVGAAGGMVLDTPPQFAMNREPAYRDWVVDAIRWGAQRRMMSVVILSPHHSGTQWAADTDRYIHYLYSHKAMPSAFVCENYVDRAPPSYPNIVGDERLSYTAAGNCLSLRQRVLPRLR